MAGLCVGLGVYPSGYTAPSRRPALNKAPVLPSPVEYNKPQVPTVPGAKRHLAMAVPGLKWPSGVKMDVWNDLRGPKEDWQINPNRINTFKELPSARRLVEAPDTPYSQAAAIREVVATMSGGAIEPKKSILDIARSFVLTAINPAVKDWWARRVNSLDQLEAIAATRGLTGEETMIRDNILSEITQESNKTANLAINAPEYKEPAAPLAIEEIKRAAAQGYYTAQKTLEQKMVTPRTKPVASPVPVTPEVKMGTPMPEPTPGGSPILSQPTQGPSVTIPSPVKFHLPGPADSPVTKPATGPVIRTTIGPPGSAGPNGTIVEINVTQTTAAFTSLMKATYTKGFDEGDAKVWIGTVARIVKKAADKVTKLQPGAVRANPTEALNVTTEKIAKGGFETVIAMRYCIETDPADGHAKLLDYLADGSIEKIFSEAFRGRFALNPGYQARYV